MKNILNITFLLFSSFAIAQGKNIDYAKRIDSLLLSRYNKGLFNGSVLVQKDGETIYKRSLGWANIEKEDTLEITDPMRIASITKTFTAVCVLQLVDEGKVNLHEDINTYLPEIEKSGITIHHLLSHKSGICYINGGPHFRRMKKYQKARGDHRWTNEDVLAYFKDSKPKVRKEPGEEHRYSNVSFTILASLIERMSGLKYKDYLQQYIFEPSNMVNSSVYLPNDTDTNPEKVVSYRLKSKELKEVPVYYSYDKNGELIYSTDMYGDKYILSTVEDMQRFNKALLSGKIISLALVEKMKTPVLLNDGKPSYNNYGYGIYQTQWTDSLSYQHGGNIAGFEAMNLFDEKGNQVILLMNLNFSERYYLYHQLLRFINGSKSKNLYERVDEKHKKRNKKMKNLFEEKYKINYAPLYE